MSGLLRLVLKLLRPVRAKPRPQLRPQLPAPRRGPAPHTGPRTVTTNSIQLQKKFKHAQDFGVEGNFNKENATKFGEAIRSHIANPGTTPLNGTYRGDPVIHYLDPKTGLNVITKPNGDFVSGWKLNADQLQNVNNHGGL